MVNSREIIRLKALYYISEFIFTQADIKFANYYLHVYPDIILYNNVFTTRIKYLRNKIKSNHETLAHNTEKLYEFEHPSKLKRNDDLIYKLAKLNILRQNLVTNQNPECELITIIDTDIFCKFNRDRLQHAYIKEQKIAEYWEEHYNE